MPLMVMSMVLSPAISVDLLEEVDVQVVPCRGRRSRTAGSQRASFWPCIATSTSSGTVSPLEDACCWAPSSRSRSPQSGAVGCHSTEPLWSVRRISNSFPFASWWKSCFNISSWFLEKLHRGTRSAPVGPMWQGTVTPNFLRWALSPVSGSKTKVVRHAIKKGKLIRKGALTLSSFSKTAGFKNEPFLPMLVGIDATCLVQDFPWTLLKRCSWSWILTGMSSGMCWRRASKVHLPTAIRWQPVSRVAHASSGMVTVLVLLESIGYLPSPNKTSWSCCSARYWRRSEESPACPAAPSWCWALENVEPVDGSNKLSLTPALMSPCPESWRCPQKIASSVSKTWVSLAPPAELFFCLSFSGHSLCQCPVRWQIPHRVTFLSSSIVILNCPSRNGGTPVPVDVTDLPVFHLLTYPLPSSFAFLAFKVWV